ncbi:signal peptide peptidase-like 2B isoform X10 [Myotis lucifugus]|uniref:signal peptide peptidase-like 2B isoform X10 n=1 Tax=Myotis lucifugus TaxID=59463 RepID=UPI000CCC3FCB|nr:signal peptide peptidase-like 2B isoform X10 [Myotis lucifugus]
MAAAAAALAWLGAACLLLSAQVACEYGMVHVVSEMGGPKGKDYCILYNPQWAHLPHDLSKASLLQLRDWTTSMLCSASDLPAKGFSNQIPLVTRGNCTFYDKVRLAQGSGAHGLLVVSKETLVPPGGNKTQYEEIGIPVALLSYKDMLDIFKNFGRSVRAALYAPHEPMLDYNMVIIFIMAVGTVALGGYWAGSRDVKKRYMKHKRDDEPEKQEDEAVDVTPVMTCVFVVMCCSMLVLLYYFYDHLAACRRWSRGCHLANAGSATAACPTSTSALRSACCSWHCSAWVSVWCGQSSGMRTTYGIGLLVTFMALALMQRGQPALLYLVPCTLITSGALALWRGELGMFWTGSGFAKDLPQPPWVPASAEGPQPLKDSEVVFSQQPPGEAQVKPTLPEEQPPELADPKDVAGVSTQEPVSPASHTPEPPGPPGTSA